MGRRQTDDRALAPAFAVALALLLLGPSCLYAQNASTPGTDLAKVRLQVTRGDLDGAERSLWTSLSSKPNDDAALVLLGVVRSRQNRYAEAESLFRRALELNAGSADASKGLARALAVQGKLDQAIEHYQAAVKLAPRDVDLIVELARLRLRRGDFAETLSTLQLTSPNRLPVTAIPVKAAALLGSGQQSLAIALIAQVKDHPAPALDLAEVFLTAKLPDEALRTLSLTRPALKPVPARFEYLRGRALLAKGEVRAASTSFRRAIALDPKFDEATLALSAVLAAQGNHSDSLALLQRARSSNPNELDLLRHTIEQAMAAGQHRDALQAASELEQRSPGNLDDQYLVAAVMLQEQRYQAAARVLETYVAQRPQDSRAFLGLGLAYLNQQQLLQARKALERSLQLDNNFAETEYQFGVLASKQGDSEEAIRHLQHAVQLQPDHAKALLLLATSYQQAGNVTNARRALERSVASDPAEPEAEYQLSLLLNRVGESAEARVHMDRFTKLKAESEYQKGVAARQEGNTGEAMMRFQHAVQLQPQHARALLSLGVLHLEAADLQTAQTELEAAEVADPTSVETERQLSVLFNRLGKPDEARRQLERFRNLNETKPHNARGTIDAQGATK